MPRLSCTWLYVNDFNPQDSPIGYRGIFVAQIVVKLTDLPRLPRNLGLQLKW